MPQAKPKHHHRCVFYAEPGDESRLPEEKGVGYTKCFHKRAWSESPYLVANEIVCAELGRMIGLPIPPYSVTFSSEGTQWFSSLYFNFDEDELPDVFPDCFWTALPVLYSGMMVFDIFVLNADRHDENIAVDNALRPKAIRLIDHDQALLGGNSGMPRGIARLDASRNQLGLNGETGGMRNGFIAEMTDSRHFVKWIKRIQDLKDWMIGRCVDAANPYGLTESESSAVKRFLRDRRNRLEEIILNNKEFFPSIADMRLSGRLF